MPTALPDYQNFGLTTKLAQEKLGGEGFNELPEPRRKTIVDNFVNVLKDPMLAMLLAIGGIYFIIGEFSDALILGIAVLIVIGITFIQEHKTEKALMALRNLANPQTTVIRDQRLQKIPSREIVLGDVLVIEAGDRIPADAAILAESELSVNESLLTGESLPVTKIVWDQKSETEMIPGGDKLPYVFMGTLVTHGKGYAQVLATGPKTRMGQIGLSLKTIKEDDTRLQKDTRYFVRIFALIGLIVCVIAFGVTGLTSGNWVAGFLNGLTLAMALLPEEFSVILVIFMAMGAWRLSRRQVLTRNLAAIETLGSTTILCVDKTGTITKNEMSLTQLITPVNNKDDYGDQNRLLEMAEYACQQASNDPLDTEIKHQALLKLSKESKQARDDWELINELPVTKKYLSQIQVWQHKQSKVIRLACKGAPEAVFQLCQLTKTELTIIQPRLNQLTNNGLRVLAVAEASFQGTFNKALINKINFNYLGLLGFNDPVRTGVREAVLAAYQAGIKVMMITGDYPGTAKAIARSIQLKNAEDYISGEEILRETNQDLRSKLATISVASRVMPEQKLKIVQCLKANGEIVAMTGDGINDAPALKAASIGIAMGNRGTDVAREAADLVLLNSDFSVMVKAIRMGRRIYDNIQKAMAYTIAVHVPIAGMALIPLWFKLPTVLFPAQVALLELLIDPTCSIIFETQKSEKGLMKRPPRPVAERLFSPFMVAGSVLRGLISLWLVLMVYWGSIYLGYAEPVTRTLSFLTLVITNLSLIVASLTYSFSLTDLIKQRNLALGIVSGGISLVLLIIISLPPLQKSFHFAQLKLNQWAMILFLGLLSYLIYEGIEHFMKSPIDH
jgi:Ca2+-transporting ATPase